MNGVFSLPAFIRRQLISENHGCAMTSLAPFRPLTRKKYVKKGALHKKTAFFPPIFAADHYHYDLLGFWPYRV